MTSGKFSFIEIDEIEIDREKRQRRELTDIEGLARSIHDNGLINPIVVTRENLLVTGERRLAAHKLLGLSTICCQYVEDLDKISLHLIELEENVCREDLDWKDHVEAVAEYHAIKEQISADKDEKWTQAQTGAELGMSRQLISQYLLVKEAMVDNVTEVLEAPKFSTARSFAWRRQERRSTTVLRDLRQQSFQADASSPAELVGEETEPEILSTRFSLIEVADFKTWSLEIPETPYNLIHCDFPYGVKAGDTIGQSGAKSYGGYEDSKEIYFDLLNTLLTNQDRFIAGSAHLFFWFSMDYYQITKDKLEAGGWTVNTFPLIWFKIDNTGILPDAQRGPRRIYETAFLCTRGDRKIVRAVGNCVAAGASKKYHMSEKAAPVLQHFFRMLVDETTVMLDPTCGSGNAVKVAEELGADWSLGLEISEEFAELARQNLGL